MGYSPNSDNPQVAQSTGTPKANNTGTTIPKFMPVKITASGIQTIDPSIEADVDAFGGLTSGSVADGFSTDIINSGIIKDTGLSYAPGDFLYVSKSGGITNVKPSVGVGGFVAGDWCIRLGVVSENASNPVLRDAIILIQIVGQL